MKTYSLLFALCGIAISAAGQIFSTPTGSIGSNGTGDQVIVNGYTKLVNPGTFPARTLIIEKDNDDSFLTFHDPGDSWYSAGIDRSNGLMFTLNPGGALGDNKGLTMTSGGNVGIGLDLGNLPDARLTVNGQIHATEVRVTVNVPGPDYVFDTNYNLPSLETIKSYIDQHHHLPEVPSAKDIETNGMMVGEMNLLLLKKVEELTLYMIEMKSENDSLKKTVDELSKKIN